MVEIKHNTEYKLLIAECTAYDFKVMLEESRPKSWLKSVSAFANTLGGSLCFGIDNDGNVKALESYKDDRRPVFKSSPSQFMTVIYSMEYDGGLKGGLNGQLNGELNGELSGELNTSQRATLQFIMEHEGCTASEISEKTNIPFSTIDKHIRVLLKVGVIERRGSKKTGGYFIK